MNALKSRGFARDRARGRWDILHGVNLKSGRDARGPIRTLSRSFLVQADALSESQFEARCSLECVCLQPERYAHVASVCALGSEGRAALEYPDFGS